MEKNCIDELQEYCQWLNLLDPEYEIIRKKKSNVVTARVIVMGKANEFGSGILIKDAKNAAASKALNILRKNHPLDLNGDGKSNDIKDIKKDTTDAKNVIDDVNDRIKKFNQLNEQKNGESSSDLNGESVNSPFIASRKDDPQEVIIDAASNAVSQLKEICEKMHWNVPQYHCIQQKDGNEPIFHCSCKVIIKDQEIISLGSGRSKKLAKQMASEGAVKELIDRNFIKSIKMDNSKIIEVCDLFEKLSNLLESDLIFESNESNDINVCDHLHAIADKIDCDDLYLPIDGDGSVFKCLLQLIIRNDFNNSLLNVSWGMSETTMDDAKKMAAEKTISMLNILRKKYN